MSYSLKVVETVRPEQVVCTLYSHAHNDGGSSIVGVSFVAGPVGGSLAVNFPARVRKSSSEQLKASVGREQPPEAATKPAGSGL